MKWMKGMFLLLVANILIMVTLSLTVPVLINVILPMFGIDLQGLVDLSSLVWALAFGFGGAFISLAFSKQMARAMLDCRQITATPVACRTGYLRFRPGDCATAPHYDA